MAAESDEGTGTEAVSTLPDRNWRPPRAGSALALLLVAVPCWLLIDALGVLDSLSLAAVGGAGVAAVVWLVGRERFASVGTLLGVAIAPLAGGLLLAGVGYALIAQLAGFAPQGTVFVALSVVVAAFGAASIPSDSADREQLKAAARSTVFGGILLFAVAGALVADAVRRKEGIEPVAGIPLPETIPSLFPEMGAVPPIGSVLLIVSLALLALRAALAALPVAELLDDRAGDDDAATRWFERLLGALSLATLGVVLGIVGVAARVLLGPGYVDLWLALPTPLIDLLGAFASSEALRWLSIRLLVVGTAIVVLTKLTRRLHHAGIGTHLGKIAVVAGALAALVGGWVGSEAVLDVVLTRLDGALPGTVAETVLTQADNVIDYYTGRVVAVALVAVGGVAAAGSLVLLRLGTLLGVVPGRHSGHALASAGLLAVGGFAAALGAPLRLALAAIVGAVVVWDLGRFGVALGRDVGRRAPSLPVQFVRVLTAVLIGVVTAGFGLAAVSTTPASLASESAAAIALIGAVVVAFLASLALAR